MLPDLLRALRVRHVEDHQAVRHGGRVQEAVLRLDVIDGRHPPALDAEYAGERFPLPCFRVQQRDPRLYMGRVDYAVVHPDVGVGGLGGLLVPEQRHVLRGLRLVGLQHLRQGGVAREAPMLHGHLEPGIALLRHKGAQVQALHRVPPGVGAASQAPAALHRRGLALQLRNAETPASDTPRVHVRVRPGHESQGDPGNGVLVGVRHGPHPETQAVGCASGRGGPRLPGSLHALRGRGHRWRGLCRRGRTLDL